MNEHAHWSESDWASWIANQVSNLAKAYRAKPEFLIADHNREISYTRDYHGRELLELLQNADDAGEESVEPNRVALFLTEEGLCVANSGTTFSTDGIDSLMVSDNSPKRKQRARYIGNKGLGFRSILNWTDCPFILSGNLAIGFDRDRAQKWLEGLCQQDVTLRRKVEDEQESQGVQSLVATLAVPAILDFDGCAGVPCPNTPNFLSVWRQAQRLKAEGYDTVVALPFTCPEAYEQVEVQLNEIGLEFLLFTRHLASLTIRRAIDNCTKDDVWDVERAEDIFSIKTRGEKEQTWQIFQTDGDIPDHLLREDLKKTPGYGIKIAVPMDDVATPGFLFTDVTQRSCRAGCLVGASVTG